jgi:hypothetical protein
VNRLTFVAEVLAYALATAVMLAALLFALTGCTVAPDTLCRIPRPRAALVDSADTIASQAEAAKVWDRHCTAVGWIKG